MIGILNRIKTKDLSLLSTQLLNRSNLALSLKVVTLTAATLAIYHQDLTIIMSDALQSEITTFMLAIPFIFAYLIYRKRKMLRAVISFETQNQPKETKYVPTIVGLLLCTAAIAFYWYGSYTFTPLEYHMVTLPILMSGLTLVLFNPQTLRQLAFPIVFLIFLMPPPAEILYALGSTLSVISSEASYTIIKALGIPSVLSSEYGNPTIAITRPDGTLMRFAVDVACSGIYGLIDFLIFAVFIAYITRDKTWKKATIFLVGLPLIYALNIVRITLILLIGYQFGEEAALQIFHLLGGWILMFLGTLLLITIAEKIFKTKIFTKSLPTSQCPKCSPGTSSPQQSFCPWCGRLLTYPQIKPAIKDIAKIASITLAIALLLSIQAPVFALTEGPAEILIQTPTGEQGNTLILPEVPSYTLKFIYRDKKFEEMAKQDASLTYAYIPTNLTGQSVFVAIEVAAAKSSLHSWEYCLLTWPLTSGYQPEVTQLDLRDTQILENPPITARYFAFQYKKTNRTQIVLYWYETSIFKTNTTSQQKHVKISLIAYTKNVEDITSIENQLLLFGKAIANYWQPIKTWTQISLTISQNGPIILLITSISTVIILAYQAIENRKNRKSNIKAYNKLASTEKLIFQAAHQAAKKEKPTTNQIAVTHRKFTQEQIPPETLLEKLNQAEKIGLIKKEITNRQDQPILAWKIQTQS